MSTETELLAAETTVADHVERFWRFLETETVRIQVDMRRDTSSVPYWDMSSFSDAVAKALVAERRAVAQCTETELLAKELASYDATIASARIDTALSETGLDRIISMCQAAKVAVQTYHDHLSVAQRPPEHIVDPTAMTGGLTKGQRIVADYESDMIAEPCELAAAIDLALSAATISCSGKDITIACDDHDTKQAVMDALTGEPLVNRLQRWRIKDERLGRGTWRGIGEISNSFQRQKKDIRNDLNALYEAGQVEMLEASNGIFWRAALRPSQAAAVLPDAVRSVLHTPNGTNLIDAADAQLFILDHWAGQDVGHAVYRNAAFTLRKVKDALANAATVIAALARPPELENERLREALKPFAEAASNFTCTIGPDGIDDGVTVAARLHGRPEREATLSSADFSRAARALRREG